MKLSFGMQLEPQFGYTKAEIDKIAEKIQETAFDMVWVSDHMFLDPNAVDKSAFDCFTLMTYLVTKYNNLRVGSMVFCNNYRYPSILAKMITTLDHLSEGRIEIGMGAGWKEIEYKAYGLEFPSAKVRIEQFEEGMQILRALWSKDKKTSFSGKYYSLENALCFPKPFQKPHPRLWIGSMTGGKRMLKSTAKYADGINLAWAFSPKQCETLFNQLDEYCTDFGRKKGAILRSVGLWARVFANEQEMETRMKAEAEKRNMSLEKYQDRVKGALIGTTEQIVEKLTNYKKVGVSHFIFMFPMKEESTYLQLFNDDIIPKVK
ncbi:MAG: LLM class flavin-dependent oxidoreductase [Promethearchaeota archaeon]